MTKIKHLVSINLVTPKARAKNEPLFNKPASWHVQTLNQDIRGELKLEMDMPSWSQQTFAPGFSIWSFIGLLVLVKDQYGLYQIAQNNQEVRPSL